MFYRLNLSDNARMDLDRISMYLEEYGMYKNNVIEKICKDIEKLIFIPRTHKTLISSKDIDGEYRRIISGKYIIIYQLNNNQINILRVFSEKQNYLDSKGFILSEKSQKYIL